MKIIPTEIIIMMSYNDVLQGRVLLIFLSTSCSACKKQVKTITQSFSALATKVKVYGVTVEEKDKAKRYVEENNLLFPLLIDNGGKMFTSLSIKYFPTNVLVENGVITKTWIGSSPSQESLLESLNLGEIH